MELYAKYKKEGLEIVCFPCNQFGRQESGTNAEIKEFVSKFGVEFHMMDKVDVKGAKTCDVYKALFELTNSADKAIRWNFATKFIVDRTGNATRYNRGEGKIDPVDLEDDIVAALKTSSEKPDEKGAGEKRKSVTELSSSAPEKKAATEKQ